MIAYAVFKNTIDWSGPLPVLDSVWGDPADAEERADELHSEPYASVYAYDLSTGKRGAKLDIPYRP